GQRHGGVTEDGRGEAEPAAGVADDGPGGAEDGPRRGEGEGDGGPGAGRGRREGQGRGRQGQGKPGVADRGDEGTDAIGRGRCRTDARPEVARRHDRLGPDDRRGRRAGDDGVQRSEGGGGRGAEAAGELAGCAESSAGQSSGGRRGGSPGDGGPGEGEGGGGEMAGRGGAAEEGQQVTWEARSGRP